MEGKIYSPVGRFAERAKQDFFQDHPKSQDYISAKQLKLNCSR